jgi:nucleotide-binding universal stress UspA family protein
MEDRRQQRIFAGFSGSPASQAALTWAASEARLRNASLHVLHVWDPVRHHASYAVFPSPTREQKRQSASRRLTTVMHAVFGPATPEWVTAELAEGQPERVLVQRSSRAGLLVIGATTRGDPLIRPAGPVVRACVTHARSPLVIVNVTAGPTGSHLVTGTR